MIFMCFIIMICGTYVIRPSTENQPEPGRKETFKICLLNTTNIMVFGHHGSMADHLKTRKADFFTISYLYVKKHVKGKNKTPILVGNNYPLQFLQIPLEAHLFKHYPRLFEVFLCADSI